MRTLIVGAGRLGRRLAGDLLHDGHDVRILDPDRDVLAVLPEPLGSRVVHGSPLDRDALADALAGCDGLVAVGDDDPLNAVVALAARRELHVPLAAAVVGDPACAQALSGLGAHILCPTTHSARELHLTLVRSGIESEVLLGGDAGIYRADVPPRLSGRSVRELERHGELLVVAVERHGRVLLAVPELTVADGDVVHVAAVHREHISDLVGP